VGDHHGGVAVAANGLAELSGMALGENEAMLAPCRALGFILTHHPSEPGIVIATTSLRD
jgi:acetyltransferase